MTKDPVEALINVTRQIDEEAVQYTITANGASAVIVIRQPLHHSSEREKQATVVLLDSVIRADFARSLQIEFAQIDMLNKEGDDNG